MKAIGYIRVSTEQQASEGVSLEAQAAKIRAYCDLNGLELVTIEADEGISGKRADNRPALQRALEALRAGEAGHLVAYSLSRLTRSVADFALMVADFERAGLGLHSVSERLDTGSASGRLVANVLASFAAFEREMTAERTRVALAHKAANGERTGGSVPYGFEATDDGRLEVNAAEAEVVERLRQWRAEGESLTGCARRLNAEGVTAKNGGAWHPQTVKRALANAERFEVAA